MGSMKGAFLRRNRQEGEERSAPVPEGRRFTAFDVAFATGMFVVAMGMCVPTAARLHQEARALEHQRVEMADRCQQVRLLLYRVQAKQAAVRELHRAVDRYVADVEAKPIVPWSTAVGELSRRRPNGLRTLRITGNGPRFQAYVSAARPELISLYTESLQESPYVQDVSGPFSRPEEPGAQPGSGPAGTDATQMTVVGQLMGE
jgi:hypothetical protein